MNSPFNPMHDPFQPNPSPVATPSGESQDGNVQRPKRKRTRRSEIIERDLRVLESIPVDAPQTRDDIAASTGLTTHGAYQSLDRLRSEGRVDLTYINGSYVWKRL